MDKLKELLAAKRKVAHEEFGGKKYVKRSEIEDMRMAKLRAEEASEREAKVSCGRRRQRRQRRRRHYPDSASPLPSATSLSLHLR